MGVCTYLNSNVSYVCYSLQTSRTALEEALHFGHAASTKLLMRASSNAKQNVRFNCHLICLSLMCVGGGAEVA